jgi:site-specific recombinase XerD
MRFDIQKELASLCARNKDGSFATQANRANILNQVARTLQKAGFSNLAASSLKPKHVETVLNFWRAEQLSEGTQKNRMAAVRWWAEKVGKQNCVPRNNDVAGIGRRKYVGTETKAQFLEPETLYKIKNERLRTSIELEQAFGLRREESLKFQPSYADKGDFIKLKGSWCKGGRERIIPITTAYQREVLQRAKLLAGEDSMIPPEKSYKAWLSTYEKSISLAKLNNLHGLRHHYAQIRFEALAGFKSPLAGGPARKDLTPEQKITDHKVRMLISAELGHGREEITAVYLGR